MHPPVSWTNLDDGVFTLFFTWQVFPRVTTERMPLQFFTRTQTGALATVTGQGRPDRR